MRKGQVWIETVLYTLIGLSIMGVILSLVKPSLDEKRDQISLNQAIEILEGINSQVDEVIYTGGGNSRTLEITMKKGKLSIDGKNDYVVYSAESKYMFSEPETEVSVGKIKVFTKERAKKNYLINMSLNYKDLNITFKGEDKEKTLQSSSTPYKIVITNVGRIEGYTNIDFSVV